MQKIKQFPDLRIIELLAKAGHGGLAIPALHAVAHMPEQLAFQAFPEQGTIECGRPHRQAGGIRPFTTPIGTVAAHAGLLVKLLAANNAFCCEAALG